MKPLPRSFIISAFLGLSTALQAAPMLFPNGDFETPGGASWTEVSAGGTYQFSYPATGGNPNGYGIIDHSAANGPFGIWVGNSDSSISLASIGLIAGETYLFTQDMTILSGNNIGSLKIDFFTGTTGNGTTGEVYPALIGDGTTWETYSFQVPIPAGTDNIKVVPLWGPDSVIGYDNIGFDDSPFTMPGPAPFAASLKTGTIVSWSPANPNSSYQPQESPDGNVWTNLGPAIIGDNVNQVFDADQAPFYRVQESEFAATEASVNGGFEIEDALDPSCAQSWACLSTGGQHPTRITTDSRSGDAAIRIAVINDDGGAPNQSEIQQNVTASGGTITPGKSYDFSFWAKQISHGVSYVQQFRLQWLDGSGAELAGGVGFDDFSADFGTWTEVSVSGLVAPAGATTAFIQIFGATGAVPGATELGEVLIDDISLMTTAGNPLGTLPAATEVGVEITWISEPGESFAVKYTTDLSNWSGELDASTDADAGETTTRAYNLCEFGLEAEDNVLFRVEKL